LINSDYAVRMVQLRNGGTINFIYDTMMLLCLSVKCAWHTVDSRKQYFYSFRRYRPTKRPNPGQYFSSLKQYCLMQPRGGALFV